jgi:hypothetical protein
MLKQVVADASVTITALLKQALLKVGLQMRKQNAYQKSCN